MRIKTLSGILLLFLYTISLVSCIKEETDFEKEETEESTVVEGRVTSTNGKPLANVVVKVNHQKNKWLQYSKTRYKAETRTDKEGKYRLHFLIRDDELETEEDKEHSVSKYYSMSFELKKLDPKVYILPGDMTAVITSSNPPASQPAEDTEPKILYAYCPFERGETYTENLYIPQKRYIRVTLKGFVPQQTGGDYDYFEACNSFPYGKEELFPDFVYGTGRTSGYMYVLHSEEERTFEIPFALNSNNILTISRRKNGVYTEEEHQLYVTEDSPDRLIYEY